MIEAKATVPYESYWVGQEKGERRGELIYRRVLLRPHKSGGRVSFAPWGDGTVEWDAVGRYWNTRAQAVQAIYNG